MKRNWKRILALMLAASMLLGNSSTTFATEATQEITEEVVEEAPEEITEEVVEETLKEITEEKVEETPEEITNEVVEDPAEETTEEVEEEIIVEEVVEADTVMEMDRYATIIPEEQIIVDVSEDSDFSYKFTPEKSAYYGVDNDDVDIWEIYHYDEENDSIDYDTDIDDCDRIFALKENASEFSDVIQGYYLEANTTYLLEMSCDNTEPEITFTFKEVVENAQCLSSENAEIAVQADGIKLFQLSAEEAALIQLEITGYFTYGTNGDSFGFFAEGTSDVSWYTFAIPAGNKAYFLMLPEEEISIKYSEIETTKISYGETKVVEPGTTMYFEFTPDPEKQSFIGNYDYIKNIFIIGNDGYDYSSNYGCPYTDVNNQSLYLFPRMKNIEKVVFAVEVESDASQSVTISLTDKTTENFAISEWTGYIELQPGESKYVSYNGRNYGEYFLSVPEEVYKEDYGWSPCLNYLGEESFKISDSYYEGYGIWDAYDMEENAYIEFKLVNNSDTTQLVALLSNEDFEQKEIVLGETYIVEDTNYDGNQEEYFEYYKFVPDISGAYWLKGYRGWVYCQEDGTSRFRNNSVALLEAGKTYLFKFRQSIYDEAEEHILEQIPCEEVYGSFVDFEDKDYVLFTPTYSGIYSSEDGDFQVYDNEKNEWIYVWEQDGEIELTAEETYLICCYDRKFGLKNKVTFLDYDYYQALIASGGSVSVNADGTINIENGENEFTLWEKILTLFGLCEYCEVDEEIYADANYYWKHPASGEYAASQMYDLDGNCVTYENIADGDVVLVEYKPEIVWAEDIKVEFDSEGLATGDKAYMYVTLTPGTEKYPFETPPEVVVDSNGMLEISDWDDLTWHDDSNAVTYRFPVSAVKAGKATVKVYADSELRYQEGLEKNILSETVTMTVGQRYQLSYNTGSVEASYENNPSSYVAGNVYDLEAPIPDDGEECGYEFAGWYSDATFKTKVSQITAKMTGNKTLYAKWTPKEYTIHYNCPYGVNPETNPEKYTIETETMTLKNVVLAGYETSWTDENGEVVTTIPKGSTGDIYLTASYNCTAEFDLKLSETEVLLPYHLENGEEYWGSTTINVIVESDPQGLIIQEYGLFLEVYKDGELTNDAYAYGYNIDFYEEGTYVVKGTYTHEGVAGSKTVEFTEQAVTVKKELPTLPIHEEITWAEASNLRKGLTFGKIKSEIENELLKETELGVSEEAWAAIVKELVIKDSKGTAVKDEAAVKSGKYIVEYTLGENEYFQTITMQSKLTVEYSPITFGEFAYVASNFTGENEDRIAGNGIACPVEINGEKVNNSAYPERIVIWPVYDTPWGEYAPASMDHLLTEKGYTVEIKWEEIGRTKLLAAYEGDDATPKYSVDLMASGTGFGTTTLQISAIIKDSEGNEYKIGPKANKFSVVSGATDIVKTIEYTVNGLEPVYTYANPDGELNYVIKKDDTAVQTSTVATNLYNYEDDPISAKLTWKSSNTSVVKVKGNSDGTATLTIPKKAQGAATITVTSKDAGAAAESFTIVVTDTGVRLDTTKVSINSALQRNFKVYLYPNRQISSGAVPTMKVEVVDKAGEPDANSIFKIAEGNVCAEEGYLMIDIPEVPEKKSGTYTVYLKVSQSIDDTAISDEIVSLKVTDKQITPKATAKLLREYNAGGITAGKLAQILVTAYGDVNYLELAPNSRYRIENTIMYYDYDNKGNAQHLVELGLNPESDSTLKNAEISVYFDSYTSDEVYRIPTKVKVSVKEVNKKPVFKVYGDTIQNPILYTDLGQTYADVILDLPDDVYDACDQSAVDIDELGVILGDTRIALKNDSVISIVNATLQESADIFDGKNRDELYGVLKIRVALNDESKAAKFKSAPVQFVISNENWFDGEATTNSLKLTGKKLSAVKTVLLDTYENEEVKTLTFRESLAGKEQSHLYSLLPEYFSYLGEGWENYDIRLEVSGDKTAQQLIESAALIVEENGTTVQIVTTKEAFEVQKAQLKANLVIYNCEKDVEAATKSTTLTLNFKSASKEPKTSITLKQKGTFNVVDYFTRAEVEATVKNLPVGAQILNVRFKDSSDEKKYEIYGSGMAEYALQSNYDACFVIEQESYVHIPTGKDSIPVIYDIQLMGGAMMEVEAVLNLNVVNSAKMAAEYSTNTLYNSAPGYGVSIDIVETKSQTADEFGRDVITNVEVSNLEELQNAGIRLERNDEEPWNLFFYVAPELSRGKEKTYTVKANVSIDDGALDKYGNEITYPVTFKLVLKK